MDRLEVVPRLRVNVLLRRTKRGLQKKASVRLLLLAVCLFPVLWSAWQLGTVQYQRDLHLAREGVQRLVKARDLLMTLSRHPLAAETLTLAQAEFVKAEELFSRVDADIAFVPEIAAYVPVYGSQIHAALHLLPLALALSQAGVASCDILTLLLARLHDPDHTQQHGILSTDLPMLTQNIQQIQQALTIIVQETAQLQPADRQFDPHSDQLIDLVRSAAPRYQTWLATLVQLLPSVPLLFGIGADTHYLLEILDVTELRPAGGFIGNYGVATLSEGRLVSAHITDTDLLDQPFYSRGYAIPFPPAYRWFDIARGNWGLRDSNLDADFPTAAQAAESHYRREGGDIPLQGVIAITPTFIEHALAITGPIYLPEYHEEITAHNLIERIHYHQLGRGVEGPDTLAAPDGYSSVRKHFTALLAEHFFAQVRRIMAAKVLQFFQLLVDNTRSKDLQLYVNDPVAQTVLHTAHLDAAMQVPAGDGLFVVDANIAANKANEFITSQLTDRITLDRQGTALHHTTLRYAWTKSGQNYGAPLYRDYVRVYVPRGSLLQTQAGWQAEGVSAAFGQQVWAGFFTLTYGQTRTITLTWTSAHGATQDTVGWHYQQLLQRQVGNTWALDIRVTLPACATQTHATGGMHLRNATTATLQRTLTENLSPALDYRCP